MTDELQKRIIELRKQNLGYRTIAHMVGVSREDVQLVSRKAGLGGVRSDNYYHKTDGRELITQHLKNSGNDERYEFVGNYTGAKGTVDLKCKVCGNVVTKTVGKIASEKGQLTCPFCMQRKRDIKRFTKSIKKLIKTKKDEEKKAAREAYFTCTCKECGKTFIGARSRSTLCSDKCKRKWKNRISSRQKDKRIPKDKRIDNVTLAELYKRDNGVCYLCGEKCDYNDYYYSSTGAFIAGEQYPSIEHIIPICSGGDHSWANVRLAHRGCNSLKGTKLIKPLAYAGMKINIPPSPISVSISC